MVSFLGSGSSGLLERGRRRNKVDEDAWFIFFQVNSGTTLPKVGKFWKIVLISTHELGVGGRNQPK